MTPLRLAFAAFLLTTAAAHAGPPVGLADLKISDPLRPLHGFVWYPAEAGVTPSLVGDSRLFVGAAVLRDAPPAMGRFPLVLLSHGWGGNALNQDWLAADLAAHGMIVAAIDHPGGTTGDLAPRAAMQVWNRPADISRAISFLTRASPLATHIDQRRVAVIGHSFGGATALALAGVRLERDRLSSYCDHHDDEGCPDLRSADLRSLPQERFDAALADPRVTAVVAMAPGLTHAMTPASLAAVTIPVLLLAGERDPGIQAAHLRMIAGQLAPSATFVEVPGAGHFDFLPTCKPGGAALLREAHDDPICDGAVGRTALHAEIGGMIVRFLNQAEAVGQ